MIMRKINWPNIDSDHLVVYSKQMSELENEMFSNGLPEESLMEKVGIKISQWLLSRKILLKNGVKAVYTPKNYQMSDIMSDIVSIVEKEI